MRFFFIVIDLLCAYKRSKYDPERRKEIREALDYCKQQPETAQWASFIDNFMEN